MGGIVKGNRYETDIFLVGYATIPGMDLDEAMKAKALATLSGAVLLVVADGLKYQGLPSLIRIATAMGFRDANIVCRVVRGDRSASKRFRQRALEVYDVPMEAWGDGK